MLTAAQKTRRSPETGDLLMPVQLVAGRDLNLRPLGYELAQTSLPEPTRQRGSPFSLIILTVGGNCRRPQTAHCCHPFVTQTTVTKTQGSHRLGHKSGDKSLARGGSYGFRSARLRLAR